MQRAPLVERRSPHGDSILNATPAFLILSGFLCGALAGCLTSDYGVPDPNHCFNAEGDKSCADKHPDGTRPFCGVGVCFDGVADGCVDVRPSDDCYSPCGDRLSAQDEMSCIGVADTGEADTDGSDTLEPHTSTSDPTAMGTTDDPDPDPTTASDTGPTDCTEDADCREGDRLWCVDQVCVDCTSLENGDAACAAEDAGAPLCDATAGACVTCTSENIGACAGATPVC